MTSDAAAPSLLRLPNLVMVGLGKSGTTSLFYYLSQHPEISPSDVKEIRFFQPTHDGYRGSGSLESYAAHFASWSGERYRLEASPQYLHGGGDVIDAMQETLGRPRIIITLRDPVDRMWSTFRSAKARRFLPEDTSFEAYVERCRRVMEMESVEAGDRPYRTLRGGFYAPYVRLWLDAFGEDGMVVFFEQMAAAPAETVTGLCQWLGIDSGPVSTFNFTTQNETRPARHFVLHRVAVAANSERLLRSHRRLKAPLRSAYYAVNGRRPSEEMTPGVRAELEQIFAPENADLRDELTKRGYRGLPDWVQG